MDRDELNELWRRVREVSGLGRPTPAVSTEVAELLVDLLMALQDALDEMDELRG